MVWLTTQLGLEIITVVALASPWLLPRKGNMEKSKSMESNNSKINSSLMNHSCQGFIQCFTCPKHCAKH